MELSLQTIFFLLVTFAVGAAVMLYMIGHWLDLSGYRYKMETQRNALNILQTIVSNSPLVYRGPNNEPDKLILDQGMLGVYTNINMTDENDLLTNPWRIIWKDCCEFHDLQYKLTVMDVVDGIVWSIGDIPFNEESDCYPKRDIAHADMPVIIYRSDKTHHPGFINITMTKTPLSDLSFWLSQAFVRASWTGQNLFNTTFEVVVPTDPEIRDVEIDRTTGLVCTLIRDEPDPDKRRLCKPFTTTGAFLYDENGGPRNVVIINNPDPDLCHNIWIVLDPGITRVTVK